MDGPLAALKLIFPQLPGLSWAAAQHTLGLSQTSSKWDLRTELTVHVLRQITNPKKSGRKVPPLGKVQAGTIREPGLKGKTWVATATIVKPPADDEGEGRGLRVAVFQSIDQMKKEEEVYYTRPELADVEVEWTGFRPNARKDEPLPTVSEEEKYKLMMAEPSRTSDITILYFHAMPHVFALLLPTHPNTPRCLRSWGNWARKCVEEPESLKTNGVFVHAKKGKEEILDVMRMPAVNFEEAVGLIETAKMRRIRGFQGVDTISEVKATL